MTANNRLKEMNLLWRANPAALNRLPPEATESLNILAMHAIPDGFTITDANSPKFAFISVNPVFEALTGYAASEIVGQSCRFLQGPDTNPETVSRIAESLRYGRPFIGEILNYRKDGSTFWNLLRIGPVRDAGGNLTHFIGMQTDISQFKRWEQEAWELRDALAHLEHVATVSELGACIGHEINQPLAAMVSNAQAAMKFMNLGDNEEVVAALRDIVDDGFRAKEIIQRIWELVRREPPNRIAVNINDIARQSIELLSGDLRKHRIRVTLILASDLPTINADPVECLQLFVNLITNAIDAIQDQESRSITLSTCATISKGVQVQVRDSGNGANDEVMAHMFEPFYTTKASGMGMGLLVCRAIVEAHHGRLWVERNPECGLTFTFSLPAE